MTQNSSTALRRVLVSGFEPFGDVLENPSEILVRGLDPKSFGFELSTVILPVSFDRAFLVLEEQIRRVKPHVVVAVGVAVSRQEITPEKIAVNFMDSQSADNDGVAPRAEKILSSGADGIFSSLPVEDMVAACRSSGVSSHVSLSAGSYVCNALMYRLLVRSRVVGFRAGFIHIPSQFDEDVRRGFFAMLKTLETVDLALP